jgi:hypothetical protein
MNLMHDIIYLTIVIVITHFWIFILNFFPETLPINPYIVQYNIFGSFIFTDFFLK